jgi:hypothetical protein
MLMPHSITDGDACFAYFNKRWGIPLEGLGEYVDKSSKLSILTTS